MVSDRYMNRPFEQQHFGSFLSFYVKHIATRSCDFKVKCHFSSLEYCLCGYLGNLCFIVEL